MKYKKIKTKKIYEEVAETLYDMIKNGILKPGEKLNSVEQLAINFQVGRSAIREALTTLKAMGLIEMRQGEGTYIREFEPDQFTFPFSTGILMNQDDISHLLEVRKIIEAGTAVAAAKRRTDKDLIDLNRALEEMRLAHEDEELGEKADLHFHLALAQASGNPLLVNIMNQIAGIMVGTMRETRRLWLNSQQSTTEKLYEEHLIIFNAILMQDEEKALESMLFHLGNVDNFLNTYFSKTVKK
jgi:GntR family transcriptional regulator, transcriptional repressor for pyruvate dehydrogenase complex